MSYLTPPRLTFSGQSYANASTANNNDIASVYDIDTMTLNPTMALMAEGTAVPPASNCFNWGGSAGNPALRTWLMSLMKAPGVDNIGEAQMAHWNYYGDHGTEFRQTQITHSLMSTGLAGASDPILNAKVELLGDIFYGRRRGGVLVDVDPYALVTSQVFSGQFRLTYQSGSQTPIPLLTADHPTVAYSYFINPHKNLNPSCTGFEPVSAVFQFGLPLAGLQFYTGSALVSPALADLQTKAQAAQGLVVRFCLYDAIFKIQAAALNADFMKGQYVSNPYEGRVLGSIGVWNNGELASAPAGRKLRLQIPFEYTPPPAGLTPAALAAKKHRMATVAKYRDRKKPVAAGSLPSANLGITLANVDPVNHVVSLDCISTFPEANIQQRDKFDLGPMNLVLLYGTPKTPGGPPPSSVVIGPVPYDKATYETGGGMVDISYATNPNLAVIKAHLAHGLLALYSTSRATNLLIETSGTDTQTDNRAAYFDAKVGQGLGARPGTTTVTLQVMRQGVAPTAPVTLNLEYWMCEKDLINPDKPQVPVAVPYLSIAGTTALAPTTYTLGFLSGNPSYPGGKVSVLTQQVQVPAGGRLTLTLTALRAGVSMVRFVDPTLQPPPPPNFAWDNCDFVTIRILPFDDFSRYTDQQINHWDFIYQNFFGFYSVIYPVMSTVVPWGPDGAPNNPTDVTTFAAQMLTLTDPKSWQSTIYMPITRDLSGGKRELLRRWCVLQQASPS